MNTRTSHVYHRVTDSITINDRLVLSIDQDGPDIWFEITSYEVHIRVNITESPWGGVMDDPKITFSSGSFSPRLLDMFRLAESLAGVIRLAAIKKNSNNLLIKEVAEMIMASHGTWDES